MADETGTAERDEPSRTGARAARGTGSAAAPLEDIAAHLGAPLDRDVRDAARRFPIRFPKSYLALAAPDDPDDPIRRIGWPDPEELAADPAGLPDPVGEKQLLVHPLVVRKHADRVILLVTSRCHFYCRFCFRAVHRKDPRKGEIDEAARVIGELGGVREVILSGGDPLVLDDERLREIVRTVRAIPGVERLRIHTRAPVHDPQRVTQQLAELLAEGGRPGATWVVIHPTHPRELRPELDLALDILRSAGLPLLAQTVLLHGVNDDAVLLRDLFEGLLNRGVKPYYLHHPDALPGSGRFRVTIETGRAIHRRLRSIASGPAVPTYVVDLPDGRGKVPVEWLVRTGPGLWRVEHADGHVSSYRDPAES